ncbi:MAG: 30S ribosomal protein S3 [bacterium]
MGQKIHPKVFRLSTIRSWDSKWFAPRKNFVSYLEEDVKIREYLKKQLREASVDVVLIDRTADTVNITIASAKPGFIIGRAGAGAEELKKKLKNEFYRGRRTNININIQEVSKPALSARIVGLQIAQEIEKRMPFRRSMKTAVERVVKGGAKGVKITVAGRLNGAEIARTETVSQGSIPLHNLRADVDFARIPARTIYGTIGVKVWIYRGEVFEEDEKKNSEDGSVVTRNK